jgi:hypothetical protein
MYISVNFVFIINNEKYGICSLSGLNSCCLGQHHEPILEPEAFLQVKPYKPIFGTLIFLVVMSFNHSISLFKQNIVQIKKILHQI